MDEAGWRWMHGLVIPVKKLVRLSEKNVYVLIIFLN